MGKYAPYFLNLKDAVKIINEITVIDEKINELTAQREKYVKDVEALLKQAEHEDIYAMSEKDFYDHCRSRGLSEEDCRIAHFIVIVRLKGRELYDAIGYSERQAKRKRLQILNIIK